MNATLISSYHGRDRRALRKIGKKDLVAAVTHGQRAPGRTGKNGLPTWKYTFANIVYITDHTSRFEITSYVKPIEIAPIPLDPQESENHRVLKNRLIEDVSLCTSHTVLIIDHSGSMKTSDVDNYRSRIDAVYGTIALDFVGAQLDSGQAKGTDVVSLIEMRDEASLIFHREPVTNLLYNTVLHRRKCARANSHGNYLPALELAKAIFMNDYQNTNCALLLLMLTDGKPSDRGLSDVQESLLSEVKLMYKLYGSRLIVGTIGFSSTCDFQLLQEMSNVPKNFPEYSHCTGVFLKSDLSAQALSKAFTILGSRLSTTRTGLSLLASRGVVRQLEKEDYKLNPGMLGLNGWTIYFRELNRAKWSPELNDWEYFDQVLKSQYHTAVAIRKCHFGEGAERVVYQFDELRLQNLQFAKMKLVAKESRFVEDEEKKMDFHKNFCISQRHAFEYAKLFNDELRRRAPKIDAPQITFLECEVYEMMGGDNILRGVLVEKMLDPGKYKKWNGNDGFVAGKVQQHSVQLDELFGQLNICAKPDYILVPGNAPPVDNMLGLAEPKPEDVIQAFSHYSYIRSKRKLLICDLQGVYDQDKNGKFKFELTDPVIHYESQSTKVRHIFGRTDRGKNGMIDFFKSHECSDVCKLLGLPSDLVVKSRN